MITTKPLGERRKTLLSVDHDDLEIITSSFQEFSLNEEYEFKDDDFFIIENIRITKQDLECLKPQEWIYDTIIEFEFQYQRNFIFNEFRQDIEIISPSLVHIFKFAKIETVRIELKSLKLLSKNVVIISVNNGAITGEGTHWSLLVFVPKERIFHHIDTLGGTNKRRAKAVVKKLLCALKEIVTDYSINFINYWQTNGYDCGLYVLHFGKIALKHFCQGVVSKEKFNPEFCEIDSNITRKKIIHHVVSSRTKYISCHNSGRKTFSP